MLVALCVAQSAFGLLCYGTQEKGYCLALVRLAAVAALVNVGMLRNKVFFMPYRVVTSGLLVNMKIFD